MGKGTTDVIAERTSIREYNGFHVEAKEFPDPLESSTERRKETQAVK